ncbi:hypothetical protein [Neobacillus rhizosphaerae]|uniref:hypothetical protein n=1 Tax=Neobacillus rhizosphaerae TaxID=2880965 RepID=UPI00200C0768|nr:hypothetical protein [Neobacillus rhizosphaerae]
MVEKDICLLTSLNTDFSKFYKYNLFIIIVEIELNLQVEIGKKGKCSKRPILMAKFGEEESVCSREHFINNGMKKPLLIKCLSKTAKTWLGT